MQLFKVNYSCQKKLHNRACLSVELNMHPNRQFLARFVVHVPLCLHTLLCVRHPLCSLRRAREVTWGMWWCKDTVACRWLLSRGGGPGELDDLMVEPVVVALAASGHVNDVVYNVQGLKTIGSPARSPSITYTTSHIALAHHRTQDMSSDKLLRRTDEAGTWRC